MKLAEKVLSMLGGSRIVLTDSEIAVLSDIRRSGGLHRKLMGSKEIQIANKLVKVGYLYKTKSDDKQKTVIYHIEPYGEEYLDSL